MPYPSYQCFKGTNGQVYCSPKKLKSYPEGTQWIRSICKDLEIGVSGKPFTRSSVPANTSQHEFESEGELEYEYAGELEIGHDRESECEFESEYESEQFLPLIGLAARFALQGLGRLAVRGIAKQAGKQAIQQAATHQREFESEFEAESELKIDPYIAKLISRLGTGEFQHESDAESEFEFISAPMSASEVVMENLAYRAAESETEAEAEAFLGALLPVSVHLMPKSSAQVIAAISPSLIQGVATIARVLHKSPKARPLLRTVPYILQGTMRRLTHHATVGKPLSHPTVLRALAMNTAQVLDNPYQIAQVMKKSHRAQHHHAEMNGQHYAVRAS